MVSGRIRPVTKLNSKALVLPSKSRLPMRVMAYLSPFEPFMDFTSKENKKEQKTSLVKCSCKIAKITERNH